MCVHFCRVSMGRGQKGAKERGGGGEGDFARGRGMGGYERKTRVTTRRERRCGGRESVRTERMKCPYESHYFEC